MQHFKASRARLFSYYILKRKDTFILSCNKKIFAKKFNLLFVEKKSPLKVPVNPETFSRVQGNPVRIGSGRATVRTFFRF